VHATEVQRGEGLRGTLPEQQRRCVAAYGGGQFNQSLAWRRSCQGPNLARPGRQRRVRVHGPRATSPKDDVVHGRRSGGCIVMYALKSFAF